MRVVVVDVFAQHMLEMAAREDQDPVEALAAHAADPAFGVRLRLWGRDRCPDHADPVRAEHGVEGFGEFDVAVADHDPGVSAFFAERLRERCVLVE